MDGFSGILDTDWVDGQEMIKDKLTDGKIIVSRFRGVYWGYELTEKYIFW